MKQQTYGEWMRSNPPIPTLTAVEWLISQIKMIDKETYAILFNDGQFEQAKQMEKEQLKDAHIEGQRVFDKHDHTEWTNDKAEQYYNETYEK